MEGLTKLTLTPLQIKKIIDSTGIDIKLVLKADQLLNGKHTLMVGKKMADIIEKRRKAGKGVHLKLSKAFHQKNKVGGFLQALLPFIAPLVAKIGIDSISKADTDDAGRRKIRQRLEYLRGNGMPRSKEFMDGYEFAHTKVGQGLKNCSDCELKEALALVKGDGFLGDFISGLKEGFFNPVQSLEYLGRELDHSLSKPKKRGSGQDSNSHLPGFVAPDRPKKGRSSIGDTNIVISGDSQSSNAMIAKSPMPPQSMSGGGITFFE